MLPVACLRRELVTRARERCLFVLSQGDVGSLEVVCRDDALMCVGIAAGDHVDSQDLKSELGIDVADLQPVSLIESGL
jgi:hypothetical protein